MTARSPAPEKAHSEAERIAEAVCSVPGVVGLHAGALGEAVTLLPGRRVAGLRLSDDLTEVHIAVELSPPLREVADAVRKVVRGIRNQPVTVVVEDVLPPEAAEPEAAAAEAGQPEADSSPTPTPETTAVPAGAEERN